MLALLRLLLRARFRHRWRSWLPLWLLVALASGLVLAGVAAGHRTATAFSRYEAVHGYDAYLFGFRPVPGITALPEVASAAPVSVFGNGIPTCACSRPIGNSQFTVAGAQNALPRLVKLVAGRMPDPSDPDQVLASFNLAQDVGVRIGTVIHVPFYAASQRKAVFSGASVRPGGATVAFRVVGIEAAETEFPTASAPVYDLYTTRAFARIFGPRTFAFSGYYVRLRHAPADFPRFAARARALGPLGVLDLGTEASAIESSIHPQAVGWWILAGLAALAGIVVVGQALARQATIEAEPYDTFSALGVTRRQLVVLSMTTTLIIAAGGVLGGVAIAFGLSPLTPVGEARLADPSPGFAFDASALLPGALAAIIVVVALGLWPAIRTARTRRPAPASHVTRPSRIVSRLASAGAPPSVLIGVRDALQRGRGRAAVPVGSALTGSILALTALCATTVFGASLTHLTSTPALYGQAYDLQLSPSSPSASATQLAQLRSLIERDRAISDISLGTSASVGIGGQNVAAIAGQRIRGHLLLTTIDGRLPGARNEVALGEATLRQAGRSHRVTHPGDGAGARRQDRCLFVPGGRHDRIPARPQHRGPGPGRIFHPRRLAGGPVRPVTGPERLRVPGHRHRRRVSRARRAGASGTGGPGPARPGLSVRGDLPGPPDQPGQLRGGSELPVHLRAAPHLVRHGHHRARPGRQRGRPPAGGGPAQNPRVHSPPGGLRRVVADHDHRPGRDRRRGTGRYRGRPASGGSSRATSVSCRCRS